MQGVLIDVAIAMTSGERPPQWFGASRMVFIPKARGAVSVGPGEVADAAADLRPLGLSNTDNNGLTSFANAILCQAASESCSSAQFSFATERAGRRSAPPGESGGRVRAV